jgi:hypothetical protein
MPNHDLYDSKAILKRRIFSTTTIPDHIKRSIRTLPSHEPSNLERKARLSQSPRPVACITGISGRHEAGSVDMFPNTDRRQIQPQESSRKNLPGAIMLILLNRPNGPSRNDGRILRRFVRPKE